MWLLGRAHNLKVVISCFNMSGLNLQVPSYRFIAAVVKTCKQIKHEMKYLYGTRCCPICVWVYAFGMSHTGMDQYTHMGQNTNTDTNVCILTGFSLIFISFRLVTIIISINHLFQTAELYWPGYHRLIAVMSCTDVGLAMQD